MNEISLKAVASAFPERVQPNEFFGDGEKRLDGGMFRGTRLRHHMAPGQTAVDLIMRAARTIEEKTEVDLATEVDIILTNVSLPDLPFTGCGAEVAKALGARPAWVYDLHNHGCVSFISMLQLAQTLMSSTTARKALICNVQTAAGRIFSNDEIRRLPQAAVPGDGCGVALIEVGDERPIEHIHVECFAENASDMEIASEDERNWWEPGTTQFHIDFSRAKVAKVVERGNRLVPEMVQKACWEASLDKDTIHTLITNQPNKVFLRNWRDALQIEEGDHVDTFSEHGNLFGAGIPVCIERAEQEGRLDREGHLVLGGFSHAGDYAAAAIIRCRGEA